MSSRVIDRLAISRWILVLMVFISPYAAAAGDMSHHMHHDNDAVQQSATVVDEQLTIAEPVTIYQPLPGKNMSAGYPMIMNGEKQTRQLLSVAAPWAKAIEIHTHQHKAGMMKMVKLETLKIKAGESAQFQPGGLHLMIFGVQQPLPKDLTMTFCFDGDLCLDQVVEVTDY